MPRPFYPRERHGNHYIRDWVGSKDCLDGCVKSLPTQGFDPPPVQRVASRCTYKAIPAPNLDPVGHKISSSDLGKQK